MQGHIHEGKLFNITVIQVYAESVMLKKLKLPFYEGLHDLLELSPTEDVLLIIRDWNAKVGSQEIPGVRAKYGHGVQNEARQRLIEFCQENTQTPSSNNTREDSPRGHYQMVSTEIRLIIFFAAKDGDALYCQQKHWKAKI